MHEQRFLFDDGDDDGSARGAALRRVAAASARPEDRDLALRVPSALRLGTSSFAFAGWRGLVYDRAAPVSALARDGLAAYAAHPLLRTVALDRGFYAPIPVDEGRRLASLTPADFRVLVKAHQSITRPDRTWDGGVNPDFLDAAVATERVVLPLVEAFGDKLGPILFQFSPLALGQSNGVGDANALVDRLDRFLSALPVGPAYAVEFRTRAIFRRPVAARASRVLAAHGVAWSMAVHPRLPDIAMQGSQLAHVAPNDASPVIVRWLLGHGLGYEEAKVRYAPFDQTVAEDLSTRAEIARLVLAALRRGRDAWVIVNNKAEGSAPRSVRMLAREIADRAEPSEKANLGGR